MRLIDKLEYDQLHKALATEESEAVEKYKLTHAQALDLLNRLVYKWFQEEQIYEENQQNRNDRDP